MSIEPLCRVLEVTNLQKLICSSLRKHDKLFINQAHFSGKTHDSPGYIKLKYDQYLLSLFITHPQIDPGK